MMKLTPEEALVAVRALCGTTAYAGGAMERVADFVQHHRVVPEWLERMADGAGKWYVRHGGRTYETVATSRASAINHVRYNLYGATAEAEVGAFDAVCPDCVILDAIGARRRVIERDAPRDLFGKRTLSKTELAERLRRMSS